jgi:hypothetical protein
MLRAWLGVDMRRIELMIGAAALVTASVSTTLYLVNMSHRKQAAAGGHLADQAPTQVISPQDLFGSPTAGDGQGSGDTETSAAPASERFGSVADPGARDVAAPSKPSDSANSSGATPVSAATPTRVHYPSWASSEAHVEEARAVTEAGGYIKPEWSPVGLDVAFTREARDAVFISGYLPGGTARALINDAGCGDDFEWNRDGMSLRVRAADGQFDQVLITGERYPAPATPPRIFARDEKIYFVPSLRPGEDREVQVSGPEDRFTAPVLSPDETRVVYRGAETGLYIAAVDGSGAVAIGAGTNPSWLPDSSGIVYDQQVSDGRAIVDADLWIAMADGSTRTNLTNTPGIVELYPSVASDGERIAFSAGGNIYVGKLAIPKK